MRAILSFWLELNLPFLGELAVVQNILGFILRDSAVLTYIGFVSTHLDYYMTVLGLPRVADLFNGMPVVRRACMLAVRRPGRWMDLPPSKMPRSKMVSRKRFLLQRSKGLEQEPIQGNLKLVRITCLALRGKETQPAQRRGEILKDNTAQWPTTRIIHRAGNEIRLN